MVSASKLRRAQEAIMKMRPYSERLSAILNNLAASIEDSVENPFTEEREIKKLLIVSISSDRGLAGAFNSNIGKAVINLINEKYFDLHKNGKVTILPIGKKSFDFFSRRNHKLQDQYYGLFENLNFNSVRTAAEFAMNGFLDHKYDKVEVVYNEFKNVATQIVRTYQFLPIIPLAVDKSLKTNTNYIFEPSQEEIFKELIPKSLKVQFYKFILESNAAEHGARMTAMDKATENAGDLLKQLKLTYNQTRQAAITKEILEIVGGAEALNNA